ncbi:MAG TPA: caspase family protein, partial [Acetobacteraceae bacterium]|nr:caspase family protein [Acetobacteraceae bacterium]
MRWAKLFLFSLSLGLLACPAIADRALAQQPQEKRVALVVGDGNYEKAPLPTAANDAGLIAQTLQAAGFDVIGARDLDADGLRNSLRDFMAKVQADPANTVAMIYLSGYVVQLAGENYFIPVDAKMSHDTDIPIEGLRISDYTRQLASIRVKISVVVLDSAGPQPFVEGGNPIAGGLALVEASPNMLIAFNAAPGTVAPPQTGNYGVYAQALAEMIRTGGLSLPDVFDRVRLRVSENSKGAQVPWDDQKIQAQFAFFDRAPDAPPVQGSRDQVAAIRDRPIRDLGAQEAFTAALTRDSFQAYEDFLAAYPTDPLAKRVRAILAARREAITWRRTYLADTPDAYWSYLRRYPEGPHAWDARRRLAILSAALEPPPSFAMMDYDLPPPPPDEYVYVDRPVLYFDDPGFGFEPPPPPPVYFLPPPPPDFIVLPPPIVAVGIGVGVGLFVLPRPAFVPMPVYCAPPAHVAPPPNNIIYNNIHNTTVINTVINNPAPAPAAIAAAAGPRRAGAPGPTTLGPSLPTHVEQRATLIQQGKLPPPPSASINPRAPGVAPGTPGATPANLPPGGNQFRQGPPQGNAPLHQELPKANVLPVPGEKGAPPSPPGAVGPSRLTTTPGEPGRPNLREERGAPGAPGGVPNRLTTPTQPGQPNLRQERTAPGAPVKPPVVQNQTTTPTTQEHGRRGPPPSATTPPPPKPELRREPPPPRAAPPPPPPRPELRRAPPPPALPRAAPPPAPPRAAPPPPPRAAPPPPAARMVAPPPPRAAPPPRPAPPPPRPAPPPPRKCPPN